jgi:hypothetical protein
VYRVPFSSSIHSRIGTVNPVFPLFNTALGNAFFGVADSARFPIYDSISPSAATSRHRLQSTNGTRTSTECVIDAQSASRKSWLRMYHVPSSALTFTAGEHRVKVSFTTPRIMSVS